MIRFIIKRLLTIIPMMLVIIFIVFALVSMSKVDPGRMKLGADASEEDVYAYNESLGLHDPLIVRYGKYVVGILKGDFGVSYSIQADYPVSQLIGSKLLLSIKIGLVAGVLGIVVV